MPRWRIGVFNQPDRRDGKAIEYLGYYNPTSDDPEQRLSVDTEKAKEWIDNGAQPTNTVSNLLEEAGMEG